MCGIFMEHFGNYVTAILYVELTTDSSTSYLYLEMKKSIQYDKILGKLCL